MFIVGVFSWWYGAGWRAQVKALQARLAGLMDFFSIDLLLRTLFAPFRQISAGQVRGPIGVQLRAFFDQLVSRFIGALIRSTIILVGVVAIVAVSLVGVILLAVRPVTPVLPLLGLTLAVLGWIPWNQ